MTGKFTFLKNLDNIDPKTTLCVFFKTYSTISLFFIFPFCIKLKHHTQKHFCSEDILITQIRAK